MKTFRSLLQPVTRAALAVCFLPLCVSLAQQASPKNEKSAYAVLATVPKKAQTRRNPLDNDPDAVAAGGKLFEQHCAECHGMKAEGTKRGPSLLNGQVERATPGALFWILSNGVVRHGMPDWSKLPEPQRWQIIAFIKSFRGSEPRPLPASSE